MIVKNNTLIAIYNDDIINGVFTAPDEVLYINDDMSFCNNLVKIILPNVVKIGHSFLRYNKTLEHLEMPNVVEIGFGLLLHNKVIKHLEMPKVEIIGDSFLFSNDSLESLEIPNIRYIGCNFLHNNTTLESIDMPNVKEILNMFMVNNTKFKYTPRIIKSLKYNLYIGRCVVDKIEYLRKLNLKKLLC